MVGWWIIRRIWTTNNLFFIPSGNDQHSYWKWPSRNSGFIQLNGDFPLVNVTITMEHHHFNNGKTHSFDWAMASSSQTVSPSLPEGKGNLKHRSILVRGHWAAGWWVKSCTSLCGKSSVLLWDFTIRNGIYTRQKWWFSGSRVEIHQTLGQS